MTATTEDDTRLGKSGMRTRIPLWVRVSAITALVLIEVLVSSMLLGAAEVGDRHGGGHGSGDDETQMTDNGASGSDHGTGGDHGSGSDHDSGSDHGS